MRSLIFASLLLAIYIGCSSASIEDSDVEESMLDFFNELKTLQLNEEPRACTPKHQDCTADRHSCCRGEMFKFVCECFYQKDGGKELCTCQEPLTHKAATKVIQKGKGMVGLESARACIEKHHECTHERNNCCKGHSFQYSCSCFKVADKSGKEEERCACRSSILDKVVNTAKNIG